ncbi:MAG: hypothetical protein LUD12_12225 [Lachnospiraceae bacterium]|nr:hypothetical protein [Lachnospiraceae bacterium]
MKAAIESQFAIWTAMVPESREVLAAKQRAGALLDRLTNSECEVLLEYLDQVQRQGFYGGYCMAMRLAAESMSGEGAYERFA